MNVADDDATITNTGPATSMSPIQLLHHCSLLSVSLQTSPILLVTRLLVMPKVVAEMARVQEETVTLASQELRTVATSSTRVAQKTTPLLLVSTLSVSVPTDYSTMSIDTAGDGGDSLSGDSMGGDA